MSSSEGLTPAAPFPGPVAAEPPVPASTSADPAPEPVAAAPLDQSPSSTEASVPPVPPSELSPERIAERVAVLDAVDQLPLPEHVELYQRLHAELQSALAEIDGP